MCLRTLVLSALCLGVCLAVTVPPAVAADYFVAPNGDDSAPGTVQQPFRSAAKALSQVKPGDTLVFRAGRYPPFEVRNLNGTPEAWITFRTHPGEHITIDRYLESRKDVSTCIHIIGVCSYLVFDGFEITNTNPQIDQVRLLNVEKPDDLAKFVAYLKPSSEGPGDIFNTGVRINPPSKPPSHHHLIFRNLEVHHLIGMGFSGVGNDWQFLDNHVYDLGRPRSGYGWYTHGDRHVYRGNVVHDNIFGFHLYSGSGDTPLRDSLVENNIVYNNG